MCELMSPKLLSVIIASIRKVKNKMDVFNLFMLKLHTDIFKCITYMSTTDSLHVSVEYTPTSETLHTSLTHTLRFFMAGLVLCKILLAIEYFFTHIALEILQA